jgi:lipopolysaccharide biosynthesis protein
VILLEICVSIPKLIALYLPQFHPIPQNDEWWGGGFTEWTNVAAARPHFRGHYQPHIPADLGFYDLRLSETREAQAALARRHGIHGFCYYHYWFNGTQLLERPFNEVLNSRNPDFPFCLCWANESWTRTWDGLERRILKKQDYSNEDNRHHIDWLIRAFQDDRYIRIEGKPLFILYRLLDIPNAREMLDMWRAEARRQGLAGLYLCAMQTGITESSDANLLDSGVDAIVDFQPNWKSFPVSGNLMNKLAVVAKRVLPSSIYQALGRSVSAERIIDYGKVVDMNIAIPWPDDYTKFPCVFPSWDNSARRKSATIIQNDDPAKYQQWLEASIAGVRRYKAERQMVFINAWNEWAEGCHLEPDRKNLHAFLTATTNALAVGDRTQGTSGPVG